MRKTKPPKTECGCDCKPSEVKIRDEKLWCQKCADILDLCAKSAKEAAEKAAPLACILLAVLLMPFALFFRITPGEGGGL